MIFVKNFLALLNENPAFLSAFNENLATNSSQTQRRTDLGQVSVTIAIARPVRVFRFFLLLSVGLKKWQQRKKRNEWNNSATVLIFCPPCSFTYPTVHPLSLSRLLSLTHALALFVSRMRTHTHAHTRTLTHTHTRLSVCVLPDRGLPGGTIFLSNVGSQVYRARL